MRAAGRVTSEGTSKGSVWKLVESEPDPHRTRRSPRPEEDPNLRATAPPTLPLWSECAKSHAGGDLQHRLWLVRSVTMLAEQVWPQVVSW